MTHRSTSAHQIASAPASDLLGWWYGNSLTGSDWTDRSGAGHHAAFGGDAGLSGGCLTLDGTDNAVAPTDLFGGLTAFTIAAWLKTASSSGPYGNYARIVCTGNTSPIMLNLTNGFEIYVGGTKRVANFGLTHDAWQHYAVSVALNGSAATVAMYLNGSAKSTGGGTITAASVAASTYTAIGSLSDLSQGVVGLIDDVRIYNVAKNATEIGAIYGEANHA